MTPVHDHEITSYLHREAERVRVSAQPATDIDDGVTYVSVRAAQPERPRRTGLVVAIAASVVLVAGLALVRQPSSREQPLNAGAAIPATGGPATNETPPITDDPATVETTPAMDPEVTVTTIELPSTPTPALASVTVPLPAGATFQGTIPSCTTIDNVTFDCAVPDFPDDAKTDDMTGYTAIVVDDASTVSGGCVSTSVDATRFTCYVGQAAVDQGVVAAGYLGDWAPKGYIAG